MSCKWKVFEAAIKAIIMYGVQCWGSTKYEQVEKTQFNFIRRAYGLPYDTPRYMLQLETGKTSLFLQNFNVHTKYIAHALSQPSDRYIHQAAKLAIEKKIYWARDWLEASRRIGVPITLEANPRSIRDLSAVLSRGLIEEEKAQLLGRVQASQFHTHYKEVLLLDALPNYEACRDPSQVSWTFKARGGLLFLNFKPWRDASAQRCSLCNSGLQENVLHFVGSCSILREFRVRAFGRHTLSEEETLELLRRPDPQKITQFCREAWSYRWSLVSEFNY